ncbi:MAG: methylated-DNA--[protein]-cysteine S-methyltransferase [Nitrospirota bacterium]
MKTTDYQYYSIPSIIGWLGLILFQDQLAFLMIGQSEEAVCDKIRRKIGFLPNHDKTRFCEWELLLQRYFLGEFVSFNRPTCFLTGTTLQKKIWKTLTAIPYGTVESYKAVANRLGLKNHARVIGMGCRENPLPVIIPCHRVICSDGTLGGYNGGIAIKKRLLAVEKIVLGAVSHDKA